MAVVVCLLAKDWREFEAWVFHGRKRFDLISRDMLAFEAQARTLLKLGGSIKLIDWTKYPGIISLHVLHMNHVA